MDKGIWEGLGEVAKGIWEGLGEVAKGIWEGLGEVAKGIWEGLGEVAKGIWEGLGEVAKGIWEGLGEVAKGIWEGLGEVAKGIWEGLGIEVVYSALCCRLPCLVFLSTPGCGGPYSVLCLSWPSFCSKLESIASQFTSRQVTFEPSTFFV